jgi:diguanylate cyclase (GGDEF)-like protein/PAS domain S-box-containing protein
VENIQFNYCQYAADYTKDYLSVIDTNYRYAFANQTYANAHNYPKEKIVGKHIADIIGQQKFNHMIKPNLDKCYQGKDISHRSWYEFRGLGYRFIEANYSPIRNDSGDVIAVAMTCHDRTEQKELEESLIENKKIIENISITDWLTDLHNQKYFEDIFPKSIKISQRNKHLLAFAIVDLDLFRSYNETYGHHAGNHVLKKVAEVCQKQLRRPSDHIFRIGGDEFALIFNIGQKEDALKLAEAIRKGVEALQIEHTNNQTYKRVTVSIGITVLEPHDNHENDSVYKLTEKLLSKAKRKGRNHTCA